MRKLAFLMVICFQISTYALAATITVDDDGPADFASIQPAINFASNGDEIVVADGVYTGQENRNINFLGKAITMRSTNGPANCIIDCEYTPGNFEQYIYGIKFVSGEDADSVLDGFTITAATASGVYISSSNPTVLNCHICGNFSRYSSGAGISCCSSSPQIINCLITGNYSGSNCGGVQIHNSDPCLVNCTIANNEGRSGVGGLACDSVSNSVLVNCILRNNKSPGFGNEIYVGAGLSSVNTLTVSYSNIPSTADAICIGPGATLNWGPGNISCDPLFVEPGHWEQGWVQGDYHLQSEAGRWNPNNQIWVEDDYTSFCIDAGDPAYATGSEPDPNGGRINMGAYGGTTEASKSLEKYGHIRRRHRNK